MEDKQRQQRRTDAQYAVSRILEDSRDLAAAAPEIFRAFGERLGWKVGVLWTVEANALRCQGMWFARGRAADGFEEATRESRFPRGAGLPGRAWEREEPCWVEDVLDDAGFLRQDAAVAAGLRCALAFPIQDGGRLMGVFEFLKGDPSPADEDLLRASYLVGHQIGQFVERRQAEYERDHALVSEKEARRQASEVLESINDAFFAVDRDWRFTYVNHRAEEFWSRSRKDIIGKKMWDELPQAVGTDISRELHRAMGGRETVGFESVSPTIGVWISVRAYPSPNGLSVYFQDIIRTQAGRGGAQGERGTIPHAHRQGRGYDHRERSYRKNPLRQPDDGARLWLHAGRIRRAASFRFDPPGGPPSVRRGPAEARG